MVRSRLALPGGLVLAGFLVLSVWYLARLYESRMSAGAAETVNSLDKGTVLTRKLWRYCVTTTYFNMAEMRAKDSVDVDNVFALCRNAEDAFLTQLSEQSGLAPSDEIRREQRQQMLQVLSEGLGGPSVSELRAEKRSR